MLAQLPWYALPRCCSSRSPCACRCPNGCTGSCAPLLLSLYALAAACIPIAAAWLPRGDVLVEPSWRIAVSKRIAACSRPVPSCRSPRAGELHDRSVPHVPELHGRSPWRVDDARPLRQDVAARSRSTAPRRRARSTLTIETASVTTGDNDKGSRARSRDEHLRSADFFNVAEFPRITFKSTRVVFTGDNPCNDRRQPHDARRHQAA